MSGQRIFKALIQPLEDTGFYPLFGTFQKWETLISNEMKINAALTIQFFLILRCQFILAQEAGFMTSGKIIFEKRVNTHALIRRDIGNGGADALTLEQYSSYQKNSPQFSVMLSTLFFSDDKTFFEPASGDQRLTVMSNHPAVQQPNKVFTDLASKKIISQKNIFNDVFLLQDSIRKISWKITGETREIAGYTCRRANAIIMDSLYVVAFYTDLILTEGGPESFNGLPGMILGVTLPRQNISWTAREVVFEHRTQETIPPLKGKVLKYTDLIAILNSPSVDRRTRSVKLLVLL
jgi:GLPGLI family protein